MTKVRLAVAWAAFALFFQHTCAAEPPDPADCQPRIAEVVSAEGRVEAKRPGGEWRAVRLHDKLCVGDAVRTGRNSRAALWLDKEAVLRLDQQTDLTLLPATQPKVSWVDRVWIQLFGGAAHFISRMPQALEVRTPFVNAAVEGTEFGLRVEPEATKLWVFEGRVRASNDAGELILADNEGAIAEAGRAPRRWLVVKPRDAVVWALYYPPLFDPGSVLSSQAPEQVAAALRLYASGDVPAALDALSQVPTPARNADWYNLTAAFYLAVGRVPEAQAAIDRALDLETANGDSLALQSIVALVRHERDAALDLAQRAAAAAPGSPVPAIALSYVHQARFELEPALAAARRALEIAPGNALAWARAAELELSLGAHGRALDAAREAVRLDPDLARTQTVLGFVHLARVAVAEARQALDQAIARDQADPLPRLGLGLAKIRRGQLAAGRREIEIAAGLDPGVSLIRSYLGKAYFEEKRDALAATQFALAKVLDPEDPTPFFYDAIRLQTENRPVEALGGLQASIERNDNRAVYRSRLLLDRDLAARSTSLGRIYRDLGFEQLALAEGWKSIALDPGNFSAHRLLADAYVALPRYELARVSELLQSQLRQPLNAAPIQPELAEAETFILRGAGPSDLAFNEFNRLFVSDGVNFQANGVIGGNDIRGSDLLVNGIAGRLSLSAGRFYYQTTGIRPNNDQQQEIYSLFGQLQVSPNTSIQAEYREREFDRGDLALLFDPDSFRPSQRIEETTRSFRVGLRQVFSPQLDMIFHARSEDFDSDFFLPSGSIDASIFTDTGGETAEVQFLLALEKASFVLGGGVSQSDKQLAFALDADPGICAFIPCGVSTSDEVRKHENVHLYTHLGYWDHLLVTLGGAIEAYEDDDIDQSQFSPKFGLIWRLAPNTTVRAAAFRALRRPYVGNQTIEPTQVSGFNQLFRDPAGTDARQYGIGFDQRLSPRLFTGAEYLYRELEISGIDNRQVPAEAIRRQHEDTSGRAYLYWTPTPRLALQADYQYERLVQSPELALDNFVEIRDHRFSLGGAYFDPSGLRAAVTATFVDQNGSFTPFGSAPGDPGVPGSSSFWTLDAAIGYRLPERLGLITLSVRNLFDEDFQFQDTEPGNPTLIPERLVTLTATILF